MKKILFLISVLIFNCSICALAAEYEDVPPSYWDYKEINEITDAGIMESNSQNYFNPKQYITRSEYAKGIIKTIKQENMTVENAYSFDDFNNQNPYWQYVISALDLDIVKPVSSSNFAPDDFVTRTEIITFLVNILKSEDITKKQAMTALQNTYSDFDDIPDWFKVTAGKAEVLGVIAKEPPRQNYLDCDKYITRAQFAYFLYKLKEITEGYEKEKELEMNSPKIVEEGGIVINNTLQNENIVTIPNHSILPIEILKSVKSGYTPAGRAIRAKFADNIIDEQKQLLLSKNILLSGKILSSEKSIPLIKNGKVILEITSANQNDITTKIQGLAECEPQANHIKGKNCILKVGQIVYMRLYKQIKVNIITGEIIE